MGVREKCLPSWEATSQYQTYSLDHAELTEVSLPGMKHPASNSSCSPHLPAPQFVSIFVDRDGKKVGGFSISVERVGE